MTADTRQSPGVRGITSRAGSRGLWTGTLAPVKGNGRLRKRHACNFSELFKAFTNGLQLIFEKTLFSGTCASCLSSRGAGEHRARQLRSEGVSPAQSCASTGESHRREGSFPLALRTLDPSLIAASSPPWPAPPGPGVILHKRLRRFK